MIVEWKYAESNQEILAHLPSLEGKCAIDIGCGEGALAREFSRMGACAVGLDRRFMVEKARVYPSERPVYYLEGVGEDLPFRDGSVDFLSYFTSFHHIPVGRMADALVEARRVLKPEGCAFFVEPLGAPGSYSELASLLNDEGEIQGKAWQTLENASSIGFEQIQSGRFYMLRSLEYYRRQIESFCEDPAISRECIRKAGEITASYSRASGVASDFFLYKSFVRSVLLRRTQ